ncbi:hypothetical protein AbraIFM66951_005105 [Aspergillus brasiliensis]|nr:hypothetical protein AbraIFM66951_005105 [Aspergillus brasiliensis]
MKGAKLLDPAKLPTAMGRLDDFTTVKKPPLKPLWRKLDMAQVTQVSIGAAGFGEDCSRYETLASTEYYYIAPRNLTASVSNIPTIPSHPWWREFNSGMSYTAHTSSNLQVECLKRMKETTQGNYG